MSGPDETTLKGPSRWAQNSRSDATATYMADADGAVPQSSHGRLAFLDDDRRRHRRPTTAHGLVLGRSRVSTIHHGSRRSKAIAVSGRNGHLIWPR